MDTLTHLCFGGGLYAAAKRENEELNDKRALFFVTAAGSQIPDIDVLSRLWDTEGLYQMWHRGLTHGLALAPLWALLLYGCCVWWWKRRDARYYVMALVSVLIHIGSDSLNAWGTGVLEPFSSARIAFGVIPIASPVYWAMLAMGWALVKWRHAPRQRTFYWVWGAIAVYTAAQAAGGWYVYQQMKPSYERVALSAGFAPFDYQAFGKNEGYVDIQHFTPWMKETPVQRLLSDDHITLNPLFDINPKARTLHRWSPFVVVENTPQQWRIYDPRFYRNGESFLTESAVKPRSD